MYKWWILKSPTFTGNQSKNKHRQELLENPVPTELDRNPNLIRTTRRVRIWSSDSKHFSFWMLKLWAGNFFPPCFTGSMEPDQLKFWSIFSLQNASQDAVSMETTGGEALTGPPEIGSLIINDKCFQRLETFFKDQLLVPWVFILWSCFNI